MELYILTKRYTGSLISVACEESYDSDCGACGHPPGQESGYIFRLAKRYSTYLVGYFLNIFLSAFLLQLRHVDKEYRVAFGPFRSYIGSITNISITVFSVLDNLVV